MWKSLITNWTTSIPAGLIALCAGTMLTDLLPDKYDKYGLAFCMFLAAIGFGAAKSANVSNAPNPVAAASVSDAAAATPNPATAVK
jgi:hypothetical protein